MALRVGKVHRLWAPLMATQFKNHRLLLSSFFFSHFLKHPQVQLLPKPQREMGLSEEKPGGLWEKINFPNTILEYKQVNPTTTPNGKNGFFFKKSSLWVGVQTDNLKGTDRAQVQQQCISGGKRITAPTKSAPQGRREVLERRWSWTQPAELLEGSWGGFYTSTTWYVL